jgi:hypothetical protein
MLWPLITRIILGYVEGGLLGYLLSEALFNRFSMALLNK